MKIFKFFDKKKDRIFIYNKRKKIKKFSQLFLKLYFIFIFIVYFLESYFLAVYPIREKNMSPVFQLNDWVLVKKINVENLIKDEKLKRGTIVAINKKSSSHLFEKIFDLPVFLFSLGFIKLKKDKIVFRRILALPNEWIAIRNKTIIINEQIYIPEWFILYRDFRILDRNVLQRDNLEEIFIPPNAVFVVNDNWDIYNDSRGSGLVLLKNIKGVFSKILIDHKN